MTGRAALFTAFLVLSTAAPFFPAGVLAGQPAAGGELGVDDIPLGIVDAEVGEWALYHLADGTRSRLTVVEKWTDGGETHLRIANEISRSGSRRSRHREEVVTVERVVEDLRNLGPEDRINESEALVHGRKLDVVVVNYYEKGELVRQSFFSDAIPVYGLVRGVTLKGRVKAALTLLDYGFAEDD